MEDNTKLQHWGILGMKWGRRRYQNKDGSLTPEGKKRYTNETNLTPEEEAKQHAETKKAVINSGDIRKVKTLEQELTNEELRKALERVDLTKRMNDLDAQYREKGYNQTVDTLKKIRTGVQEAVDAYNLAAKINNTFNKDKQLRVIDGKYVDMAAELASRLNKTKTAEAVRKKNEAEARKAEAEASIKEEELRQKRERK